MTLDIPTTERTFTQVLVQSLLWLHARMFDDTLLQNSLALILLVLGTRRVLRIGLSSTYPKADYSFKFSFESVFNLTFCI